MRKNNYTKIISLNFGTHVFLGLSAIALYILYKEIYLGNIISDAERLLVYFWYISGSINMIQLIYNFIYMCKDGVVNDKNIHTDDHNWHDLFSKLAEIIVIAEIIVFVVIAVLGILPQQERYQFVCIRGVEYMDDTYNNDVPLVPSYKTDGTINECEAANE